MESDLRFVAAVACDKFSDFEIQFRVKYGDGDVQFHGAGDLAFHAGG